jgi:hypothetical protein
MARCRVVAVTLCGVVMQKGDVLPGAERQHMAASPTENADLAIQDLGKKLLGAAVEVAELETPEAVLDELDSVIYPCTDLRVLASAGSRSRPIGLHGRSAATLPDDTQQQLEPDQIGERLARQRFESVARPAPHRLNNRHVTSIR